MIPDHRPDQICSNLYAAPSMEVVHGADAEEPGPDPTQATERSPSHHGALFVQQVAHDVAPG